MTKVKVKDLCPRCEGPIEGYMNVPNPDVIEIQNITQISLPKPIDHGMPRAICAACSNFKYAKCKKGYDFGTLIQTECPEFEA